MQLHRPELGLLIPRRWPPTWQQSLQHSADKKALRHAIREKPTGTGWHVCIRMSRCGFFPMAWLELKKIWPSSIANTWAEVRQPHERMVSMFIFPQDTAHDRGWPTIFVFVFRVITQQEHTHGNKRKTSKMRNEFTQNHYVFNVFIAFLFCKK